MAALRDYQVTALDEVRAAVGQGERRLMVQMPTGAGKTRLAAEIVNGARGKKKRLVFTVPAINLIDQTVEAFYAEGVRDIGVIQANHPLTDWSRSIQIASVQTLQRRDLPQCDVVIQDEAHRLFKSMLRWMTDEATRNTPFIGLSATPWTKGLGRVYQRLIVGTTTQQLIDAGWLCKFRVLAPSHPDLRKVRIVAGDFQVDDLSIAMQQGKLIADIIQTWKDHAEGRPTICFAVDRAHAKALQERFEEAGVPSGYMDCMSPMSERKEVRAKFLSGAIKVVCNVEIIGIGIDWPEIACISYCRPTRSEMRFVQNIGRGLRPSPGKKDLLILDHSDTHLRLGFVTEINHDTLNDGKEKPAAPSSVRLPKECKACGYLKPYGALICPNCGEKSDPAPVAQEFSRAALEEFNGKKSRGKREVFTDKEKAIFLAELKGYAVRHNYKSGWASQKYRARFDVWPNWKIKDIAPLRHISPATQSWITAQNMAWIHSKKRKEVMSNGNGASHGLPDRPMAHPEQSASSASRVEDTLCTEQDFEDFR